MQLPLRRRHVLAALAAVVTGIATALADAPTSATGVHMIMMEEPGCRYCAAWDADVGKGYASTAEGQFAPLLRVRRDAPELALLSKPATYTPTFIVMKDAKEVGRITGYPGQFYFWEELKEILTNAGFKANTP